MTPCLRSPGLRLMRVTSAGAAEQQQQQQQQQQQVADAGDFGGSSSSSSGGGGGGGFKELTSSDPAGETEKRGPGDDSCGAAFYPFWAVVVTFGSVTFGSGTTHTFIHTCAHGVSVVSARCGHDGFARAAGGSVWP